jgi:hypothetical protein
MHHKALTTSAQIAQKQAATCAAQLYCDTFDPDVFHPAGNTSRSNVSQYSYVAVQYMLGSYLAPALVDTASCAIVAKALLSHKIVRNCAATSGET